MNKFIIFICFILLFIIIHLAYLMYRKRDSDSELTKIFLSFSGLVSLLFLMANYNTKIENNHLLELLNNNTSVYLSTLMYILFNITMFMYIIKHKSKRVCFLHSGYLMIVSAISVYISGFNIWTLINILFYIIFLIMCEFDKNK